MEPAEAVINPLTASLFPKNKTHWLNILHAGWPLGLILGALITLAFEEFLTGIRWEYKLGVFLIPVLAYGVMMFNRPFPKSEAKTAGVPMPEMMKQVGMLGFTLGEAIGLALVVLLKDVFDAPGWIGWVVAGGVWLAFGLATNFAPGHWVLAFLYIMHAGVGYVELGTDSWIINITKEVLQSDSNALLAFIWTNVLMFTLRFFAGPSSTGSTRWVVVLQCMSRSYWSLFARPGFHQFGLALGCCGDHLWHWQDLLLADLAGGDLRAFPERRRACSGHQWWSGYDWCRHSRRSGNWLQAGLVRG